MSSSSGSVSSSSSGSRQEGQVTRRRSRQVAADDSNSIRSESGSSVSTADDWDTPTQSREGSPQSCSSSRVRVVARRNSPNRRGGRHLEFNLVPTVFRYNQRSRIVQSVPGETSEESAYSGSEVNSADFEETNDGVEQENNAEPSRKRRRLEKICQNLMQTPEAVQRALQTVGRASRAQVVRSLHNCILSSASGDAFTANRALLLLESMLHSGVATNYEDEALNNKYGGSPLFIAVEINAGPAAAMLLRYGALLSYRFQGKSVLQLAFQLQHCTQEINHHLRMMEEVNDALLPRPLY